MKVVRDHEHRALAGEAVKLEEDPLLDLAEVQLFRTLPCRL